MKHRYWCQRYEHWSPCECGIGKDHASRICVKHHEAERHVVMKEQGFV